MTRFARHGDGRKRPLQASSWTDLKGASKELSNAEENGTKKNLKNIRDWNKTDKVNKRKKHLPYKNTGKFDIKCYSCQSIGHKASECAEPKTDMETVCYSCQQNGHKAFNCPQKIRGLKEEWKKVKRSEFRRQKRQIQVQSQKECFNCRETGHKLSECPKLEKDMEHGTGICFKCGSTEHSVNKCKAKVAPGEYPYAKCFICGETGHLSKQCPDNPRGLYPRGGCCNECGSVEHLKRDCPEFQQRLGIGDIKLQKLDQVTSLDAELSPEDEEIKPLKKKKHKLVKF